MNVTFIGGGNMGQAILGGLLAKPALGFARENVHVVEIDQPTRDKVERDFGVKCFGSPAHALRQGAEREHRKDHAKPRRRTEHVVFRREIEQAGRRSERHLLDPAAHRLEPMLAQQRHELPDRRDERDQVDEGERPLE